MQFEPRLELSKVKSAEVNGIHFESSRGLNSGSYSATGTKYFSFLKDFELLVIPSVENLGGVLQWTPSCRLPPFSPLFHFPGISEVSLPPGTEAG